MDREIKKRQLILMNRRPFSESVRVYVKELNAIDWVYSSLRLTGLDIDREAVRRILGGELVVAVPLNTHSLIGNYHEMIERVGSLIDADYDLSERYLNELHAILVQPGTPGYRQDNPVLRHLGYNPPHFKELEYEMGEFFRSFYSSMEETDPLTQAATLHNRLIQVYPYAEQTEATARAAAQYILMQNGYPPIEWSQSEPEYFNSLRHFLKYGDSAPLVETIGRSLWLKLGVLLQLTQTE